MIFTLRQPVTGEILVAWQKYVACNSDEITLKEGDIVELLDTDDPSSSTSAKRARLDPELDPATPPKLLDSSAARHKLSVKPRRNYSSSRHSPTRLNLNARWLVREVNGNRKEGWVPCKVLQTIDDPTPGKPGLPGDALFRRQVVVKELVETEQEFVKDLDYVVKNYLLLSESGKVPKVIRDNCQVIFGNLKEIAEFHRTVLMEGVKYYANEPHLLGKAFLRLERDFDKHVDYYLYEPQAQAFLDGCDEAHDYFDELSQRLGDDKTISEHLKLPIQRINDYQLLLKELVRYSTCLAEDSSDLQKALELMLSVPHRAQDDKFTNSIEGYRGSIHKLGRLLAHDWFSIKWNEAAKERYLFLFKGKILICKVRRISEDRSVFQLKDIIQLNRVAVKEHPEDDKLIELVDNIGGHSLYLTAHRDHIAEYWLKEIKEFARDYDEEVFLDAEEFQEENTAKPSSKQQQQPSKPSSIPSEDLKPSNPAPTLSQDQKISSKPSEDQKSLTSNLKTSEDQKSSTPNPESSKDHKLSSEPSEDQKSSSHILKSSEDHKSSTPNPKPSEAQKSSNPIPKVSEDQKPSKSTPKVSQDRKPSNPVPTPSEDQQLSLKPSNPNPKSSEDHTSLNPCADQNREETAASSAHLAKIQAVEPLVQLNKKRELEQPIQRQEKHELQGSALQKVYSVESVPNYNTVKAEYSVGIEVNVEVDDMSRRYTSSSSTARAG